MNLSNDNGYTVTFFDGNRIQVDQVWSNNDRTVRIGSVSRASIQLKPISKPGKKHRRTSNISVVNFVQEYHLVEDCKEPFIFEEHPKSSLVSSSSKKREVLQKLRDLTIAFAECIDELMSIIE